MDVHPLSPNVALEEERDAAHTITEDNDDTSVAAAVVMSSSWRPNVLILGHVFVHAVLVSIVVGAIVVSINKVYLYDHFVNHANITLSDRDLVVRHSYISIPGLSGYYVLLYAIIGDAVSRYDPSYLFYLRVWSVISFVIIHISVYYNFVFIPKIEFASSVFVVVHIIICFIIVCLAAKRNGGDRNCIKRIAILGFYSIVGGAYIAIVTGSQVVISSPIFQWISPFALPATTFLIRYAGQRTEFPEMCVAKGSSGISVLSSVVSRILQCAYLTHENVFSMFLGLEVFYDVVGVIIRVTLHHRQLITDTIFSGKLWKDGKLNFKLTPQGPRSRLISSITVTQSVLMDYASFVVVFATRASLLTSNEVDAGTLIGVFLVCSILQMLCCFVTHLLIRKVEAVPLEELDIDIVPLNKLWTSQYFFIAVVLCYTTSTSRFMYQTWFSMSETW